MVAFEFGAFNGLCRAGIYGVSLDRLVELYHEPVAEVLRNAAAVACGISHDCILFRKHLYI